MGTTPVRKARGWTGMPARIAGNVLMNSLAALQCYNKHEEFPRSGLYGLGVLFVFLAFYSFLRGLGWFFSPVWTQPIC